jgi:hypothetical protein
MTPGKAFWLITKDGGKVIDTGPGKSVPTNTPYTIALNAGWNLVSNPYDFQIPLSKLSLADGESVVLHSYEGAWNNTITSPVTAMDPFSGYGLKVTTATTLTINGDLSTGPLPKKDLPAIAWWVGIEAQCGDASDVDNVAMVAQGADRALDQLDVPEPPVIGDYVTVHFPHPEWGAGQGDYCVDARPDIKQGEVWEFDVKTASKRAVQLKFTSLEKVPPQYQVWLVDEAVKVRQDIRLSPAYGFSGTGEGVTRHFAMIVGEAADVEKLMISKGVIPAAFELAQNFPNPFNPTTTIPFALPFTSHVRLSVYSVLGQEVALLFDGILEQGYHTVQFDAHSHSSGSYFVRMSGEAVGTQQAFTTTRKIILVK